MIDLQLHTTDSDGTWSWDRVLTYCKDIDLKACAITDHDTAIRRQDILDWGKSHNFYAIPGIELSTRENNQTVHLLGYFLDGPLKNLEEKLDYLRSERAVRNKKIIEKLNKLGVQVSVQDVESIAGSASLGRPHIARVLMEKGHVKSIKEAFDRYLAIDGTAYVPKAELPLREAIDLLHEAGCVTSMAHPLLLDRSIEEMELSFKRWRDWGVDALESLYPTYTEQQTSFMERMTSKYGYIRTGGSDFHGENKPHIKIGVGTGQLNVPDELLAPLIEKRNDITRRVK